MTRENNNFLIKQDTRFNGKDELNYSLSVSEGRNLMDLRIPLYSVTVDMTDENGKRTSASCTNAFVDIGHALIFYGKIVGGLVTPCELGYVYEDECC